MRLTWLMRAVAILFLTSAICSISNAQAPDNRHVVTVTELSKDAAAPAEARQANESAIRHLMSSEPGQKALGVCKNRLRQSRQSCRSVKR